MGNFNVGDLIRRNKMERYRMPIDSIHKVTHVSNIVNTVRVENFDTDFCQDYFDLVIPAKWCIKGCVYMAKWQYYKMKDICNVNFFHRNEYYSPSSKFDLISWDKTFDIPDGFTEISFNQFKKFILKDDSLRTIKFKRKDA